MCPLSCRRPARGQVSLSIIAIRILSHLYDSLDNQFVILHITPPSKDEVTKAMYERFMAEESCPFEVGGRTLGMVMGARMEGDKYVLVVSINDQYALEHFHELMSRASRPSIAQSATA